MISNENIETCSEKKRSFSENLKLILPYCVVASIPLVLYLPFLGSQGLWDPWETHYSEVARRILIDRDWITLRWHDEKFFSKPVFLFWTIALSFKAFGVNEWAARFPVVIFSTFGIVMVFHYTRKIFGTTTGILASFVLSTMPFWAMLSRQAITDMEFVAPMSAGLLALIWRFSCEKEPHRINAIFAYFCFGVAVLAKGLLGVALPGAVLFFAMLLSGRNDWIKRARLPEGIIVFLAVSLPWYLAVSIINGKSFLYEFFFLHHFARAGGGVHGERGTFEYFIPQIAWGMLPWTVIVLPAVGSALIKIVTLKFKEHEKVPPPVMAIFILVIWACGAFGLFTIARTKFHHYIFPAVVPVAILAGVWLAEKFRELKIHSGEFLLTFLSFIFCVVFVIEIKAVPDRITYLITYAYERPAGSPQRTWWEIGTCVLIFSAGLFCIKLLKSRIIKIASSGVSLISAILLTSALLYDHMPAAARHVSQKEYFDIWTTQGKKGDRFYNWKMNWRGEIFYSKDRIKKASRLEELRPILAKPGRTFIISTIERYKQLDLEIERIRGKGLRKLGFYDSRYGFGVFEGEPISSQFPVPTVKNLPADATPTSITLGGGLLELVGYRVGKRTARIGDSIMVTLYWKPLKKINERWIVFIYGEMYADGDAKRFNGNHVTGEGSFGTERWEVGTIVEDAFAVCVDYGIPSGIYELSAGLYREKERMQVDEAWLHDGNNRIFLGKIKVEEPQRWSLK